MYHTFHAYYQFDYKYQTNLKELFLFVVLLRDVAGLCLNQQIAYYKILLLLVVPLHLQYSRRLIFEVSAVI